MNNVIVEVIGARNDYKVQFETWEDAEKYCDENKYYFNNASVFITQGDRCKAFDYRNLIIYKDAKGMNIQPTTDYMKSILRRPLNRIYCPECNRILCPATDKCICGQNIKWVG